MEKVEYMGETSTVKSKKAEQEPQPSLDDHHWLQVVVKLLSLTMPKTSMKSSRLPIRRFSSMASSELCVYMYSKGYLWQSSLRLFCSVKLYVFSLLWVLSLVLSSRSLQHGRQIWKGPFLFRATNGTLSLILLSIVSLL